MCTGDPSSKWVELPDTSLQIEFLRDFLLEFLVCTQPLGIQMTKVLVAMLVNTTKECNYNSIVIVHHSGSCVVICKSRISFLVDISVAVESNKLWLTWSIVCVVVPCYKFKDISMIFRPSFLPHWSIQIKYTLYYYIIRYIICLIQDIKEYVILIKNMLYSVNLQTISIQQGSRRVRLLI